MPNNLNDCSNHCKLLRQNRAAHNYKYTKEGTDQRIIQNVRVGGFGDTKESLQMYPYV